MRGAGGIRLIIEDHNNLSLIVRAEQVKGNKVVFTNGVFDVVHIGHLHSLFESFKCGDVLVVGLNSDSSTKRVKGGGRPIVPQDQRAKIIDAMYFVDYVTFFEEDTPIELMKRIKPDVITKGGDYEVKTLPETPVVRQWGCDVVITDYLEGHGTTSLVRRIRDGK